MAAVLERRPGTGSGVSPEPLRGHGAEQFAVLGGHIRHDGEDLAAAECLVVVAAFLAWRHARTLQAALAGQYASRRRGPGQLKRRLDQPVRASPGTGFLRDGLGEERVR